MLVWPEWLRTVGEWAGALLGWLIILLVAAGVVAFAFGAR